MKMIGWASKFRQILTKLQTRNDFGIHVLYDSLHINFKRRITVQYFHQWILCFQFQLSSSFLDSCGIFSVKITQSARMQRRNPDKDGFNCIFEYCTFWKEKSPKKIEIRINEKRLQKTSVQSHQVTQQKSYPWSPRKKLKQFKIFFKCSIFNRQKLSQLNLSGGSFIREPSHFQIL